MSSCICPDADERIAALLDCKYLDKRMVEAIIAERFIAKFDIARAREEKEEQDNQALDILQRVWLKLNCGVGNETDSKIADSAWDYICNVMGVDEAMAWSEKEVPDED